MNLPALTIEANPGPNDLEFMDDRINEFNVAQTGFHDFQRLAGLIRDDAQNIIAGVTGFHEDYPYRHREYFMHKRLV